MHTSLPAAGLWPERRHVLPVFSYPEQLNAAHELLVQNLQAGRAEKAAIYFRDEVISYQHLADRVFRTANALRELGIQKGDRVMLRSWNRPEAVVAWLAVGYIGAVNVATMPLLRARELRYMANDADCVAVICGHDLWEEVTLARPELPNVRLFLSIGDESAALPEGVQSLSLLAASKSSHCNPADTKRDDLALIGYTSGSTGEPKGCVSFQDDVLAIADGYARHILTPTSEDVFGGHPSLAFTFGLGALLIFPFRFGSATVLLDKFTPQAMLDVLVRYRVTLAFCAPTCYRMMLDLDPERRADLSGLRYGVSAGETLPGSVFTRWKEERGIELLDGIGSTELLHIFLSTMPGEGKPNTTGRVVPGYEAKIVDDEGNELPDGEPGLLAVLGPTGCRYWKKPERQKIYVKNGWNYPGDVFVRDSDGLFHYQCRSDDLIVTAGYNVAGVEVEQVLNEHAAVRESGVVGVADELRGTIVKAFVVLKDASLASEALATELQDWVKGKLAPYKYPRQIEFVTALPRTDTGKVQRFRLRNG